MGHDPAARRPSETAQPTDHQHEGEYDRGVDCHARSKRNHSGDDHGQSRKHKTDAKKLPCVRPVGNTSHDKFRKRVGDRDRRHRETGLARIDDPVADHIRSSQRKVFTDKIVTCIAQKSAKKDLGAHYLIGFVHLVFRKRFTRLWRI